MSKVSIILVLLIVACFFIAPWEEKLEDPENIVNVYGWYGIIPRNVIDDFEKETGVKVRYDIYDNNDTLEAKLLTGNSGYDVVFPSFIPYAVRQMAMKAYMKLNLELLPNLQNIHGILTEKFKQSGGSLNYLIPLFWGTVGIVYEKNAVDQALPGEKIDSYEFLFNPAKLKKLFQFGVSFPDEYIDIFPQLNAYMGNRAKKMSISDITKYCRFLSRARPYITKFSSTTVIADLLSGDVCIAIGASDNSLRAMRVAKHVGKNIEYVIPKEAGILWIDCAGVPDGAPHFKNAHRFIDFLLKPEIAARIANHSGVLVNVSEARRYFKEEIINNDQIYPTDPEVLSNLILWQACLDEEGLKFERMAMKEWSKVKMNSLNKRKIEGGK
ncbi:MAG: extracellular solute-binding protein [Holosporales bacterium]|jgi:putrescine transport system substrate-binding protein|nr:extracellular solute-binding protein [Holosporales bacterium]